MPKLPHCIKRILYTYFATVVAGGWLLPAAAQAHSLFIQSGRHQVSQGKASPLFFCYGHHFPVDGAIDRKKLAYVRVIVPDGRANEIALRDDRSLHSYLVTYEQPGTYALVAETNPGHFAMYTDKRGRQRHSLKPMSAFAGEAAEILSSMRSSQWAKTYVFCETPSDSFPARVGLPLELVPATDLSRLKEGDSLSIQVFNDGAPYTGEGFWDATYNGYSTEAEDMYIPRTACAGGRFVMPVDVSGRWFVRFFTKTPAPEDKRSEYRTEKRTTTLVFEVRNARRRPEIDGH
jgi:uncharacterized GH25 family protein